jgi:hypothetical protein
VADALRIVRVEEQAGREAAALYDQVIQLLHALLLLGNDPEAAVPFPAAHRAGMRASASKLGSALLVRLLSLALEGKGLVASAEKPGVAVAVTVGRLALWPRLQRVEALLSGEPAPPTPDAAGSTERPEPPVGGGPASPGARLVAALETAGAHLLAGRVGSVREASVEGDTLVLHCGGLPASARKSLREAVEQLAAAAREAGIAERVRVDDNGPATGGEPEGLRARVQADEGVRRVLEVFGGRLESVEEKP